jgi:hypothetical protein
MKCKDLPERETERDKVGTIHTAHMQMIDAPGMQAC